jgi:glycosyltransferase involved in cell wall biosynthesis
VVFKRPRTADFRASVHDIAEYLMTLMTEPALRRKMGEAGRERAVKLFDYRVVARSFLDIVSRRLGISQR